MNFISVMTDPLETIKPLSPRTKQFIKWGFVCFFFILFLVLQFVIYKIGYGRGWLAGSEVPPERIIVQSDQKAMGILAQFMADSVSGAESLEQMLKNREERLSWIRDKDLRADVMWGLARDLLLEDRNSKVSPESILSLIREYSVTDALKWAGRAEWTGDVLSSYKRDEDAVVFFNIALNGYQQAKDKGKEYKCYARLLSSYMSLNRQDDVLGVLESMYSLSPDRAAKSSIRATMARIVRQQGKNDLAGNYFREALQLLPENDLNVSNVDVGSAKICMAELMMESGRYEEAGKLFKEGLGQLDGDPAVLSFMLSAYRGLAKIESMNKKYPEALARLFQAEGAAKGHLAPKDPFWSCLYDQRGWVLLDKAEPDIALKEFKKVIVLDGPADALAQSLEGAGFASILLGKEEEACNYLGKALKLREEQFPDDKVSLARVYKHLGTANDLSGNNAEAVDYFNRAVNLLKETGKDQDMLYLESLLCKAYVLSEGKRWNEAIEAFNAAMPLLKGEQRVETLKNLATCYDNSGRRDKGDECWKEAGFPRVVVSTKKRGK